MNISTVRLIVPLLCGLLVLAVQSGNAKEPKIKPSVIVKIKTNSPKPNERTTINNSKSNNLRSAKSPTPAANARASSVNGKRSNTSRTSKPQAKATPHPDLVGIDFRPGGDAKPKYKAKAAPTPKAK